MSLSLRFYVISYLYKKPIVESARDVHVTVEDECNVVLDESNENLTEAQRDNIQRMRNSPFRQTFLFYMNKEVVDKYYLDKHNGKLELHCPECGKDYVITKSEYDVAYQRFLEGDE